MLQIVLREMCLSMVNQPVAVLLPTSLSAVIDECCCAFGYCSLYVFIFAFPGALWSLNHGSTAYP